MRSPLTPSRGNKEIVSEVPLEELTSYLNNSLTLATPLARICNPCYDLMARIATNGQRPKGDK